MLRSVRYVGFCHSAQQTKKRRNYDSFQLIELLVRARLSFAVSTPFPALAIRPEVAEKLGHYVYAYIDPRNEEIFYVGKGCRTRALAHLSLQRRSLKLDLIGEIRRSGLEPRIDILAHGLPDEKTALWVEAAVIDALWTTDRLTNRVRGHHSRDWGRVELSELAFLYGAKPVRVAEPSILIRINRLYRPGMTAEALYEATRGVWKVGARRNQARFALSVFEGVVRQVYSIESWQAAGTAAYNTRELDRKILKGRWEFSGVVDNELSRIYHGRSVRGQLSDYAQNPITYVNC